MPIRRQLAPLLALLLTVLAGCGGTVPTESPGPVGRPPPADLPGTPTGPGGFSTTDVAWLQLTIAMDERILRVLELVPDRAIEPEVDALAEELASAHRDALAALRSLYNRAEGPRVNPHAGHDMPGMATDTQLGALRRATGRAAVDIFAEVMRAHLDQSVRLAHAAQRHGTEPATRAAAAETERTRAAQRGQLDQLLPTPASPATGG